MELRVLYRDELFVAVDKPSGLLVHPLEDRRIRNRNEPTCMALLRDQIGRWVYPLHRLDRPTSGVVMFGLSSQAASLGSELFRERKVEKTYYAICRGWTDERGVIDEPIDDGEAVTEYLLKQRVELPVSVGKFPSSRYSLLEVRPLTGRFHQIRRHLKRIGHPLVGDTVRGDGPHNRLFRDRFGVRRLLLWCTRLAFEHPQSLEKTEICAAHPIEVTEALRETFRFSD